MSSTFLIHILLLYALNKPEVSDNSILHISEVTAPTARLPEPTEAD